MIWKTLSSRVASRPVTATTSIRLSQPAIHSAALGFDGVRFIGADNPAHGDATRETSAKQAGIVERAAVCNGQMLPVL